MGRNRWFQGQERQGIQPCHSYSRFNGFFPRLEIFINKPNKPMYQKNSRYDVEYSRSSLEDVEASSTVRGRSTLRGEWLAKDAAFSSWLWIYRPDSPKIDVEWKTFPSSSDKKASKPREWIKLSAPTLVLAEHLKESNHTEMPP